MKNTNRLKKLLILSLFPLGLLLSFTASKMSRTTENLYSSGVYPLIGRVLNLFTGFFPFSVGEIFIILLIFFVFGKVVYLLIQIFHFKTQRLYSLGKALFHAILFLCCVYFTFIIVWGLNYHRLPFATIADLDTRPASIADLERVCKELINKTNLLRQYVKETPEGVMYFPKGDSDVLRRAIKGYVKAELVYIELGGSYGNPKAVYFSRAMTIAGIQGIYFPFTGEANVNIETPSPLLPSTVCHEMAHQRGFAREDEANYIAYLTCMLHPDKDFQYSGSLLALMYSMNALYKYNPDHYYQLQKQYSKEVQRDLNHITDFWKQFEGPVERASSKLNNAYLKSNMQADGIYSYGRMVDLLIAEHRTKGTLR